MTKNPYLFWDFHLPFWEERPSSGASSATRRNPRRITYRLWVRRTTANPSCCAISPKSTPRSRVGT